eukprot:7391598-Prymnesium_polylepis.4
MMRRVAVAGATRAPRCRGQARRDTHTHSFTVNVMRAMYRTHTRGRDTAVHTIADPVSLGGEPPPLPHWGA